MVTENGIVIRTDAQTAWVKTIKTSACESCTAKGTCHSLGGGKEMEVEAINYVGAKTGDTVIIGFETGPLLKISALIYLLPIVMMIIGAVMGQKLSTMVDIEESALSAILAFAFFGAAFLIVRAIGKTIADKEAYRAKVIRIANSLALNTRES